MHHQTDLLWLAGECSKATTFAQLVEVAINELMKFSDGCEVVCGPISTGGRGNVDENLRVFEATINRLKVEGNPIFSQIPYEDKIFLFRKRWQESDPSHAGQYYMPILLEFYLPLFKTRKIRKGWFIPGWQSSFGARWEREHLIRFGSKVIDLTNEWVDVALRS